MAPRNHAGRLEPKRSPRGTGRQLALSPRTTLACTKDPALADMQLNLACRSVIAERSSRRGRSRRPRAQAVCRPRRGSQGILSISGLLNAAKRIRMSTRSVSGRSDRAASSRHPSMRASDSRWRSSRSQNIMWVDRVHSGLRAGTAMGRQWGVIGRPAPAATARAHSRNPAVQRWTSTWPDADGAMALRRSLPGSQEAEPLGWLTRGSAHIYN